MSITSGVRACWRSWKFPIPMRGNEHAHARLEACARVFPIPMRGNEIVAVVVAVIPLASSRSP